MWHNAAIGTFEPFDFFTANQEHGAAEGLHHPTASATHVAEHIAKSLLPYLIVSSGGMYNYDVENIAGLEVKAQQFFQLLLKNCFS
ncbi:hypothetical protein [Mucilaginibacter sp. CSA2-8R]|uniref:hypothetical protein n=1 Tax=Mucilaginibacter sp. CSA2-8R TaxID=3141542 RepID=UPI00315DEEEA